MLTVWADSKWDFSVEKIANKLYSLNEKKLLELKTEKVDPQAQQDQPLAQTGK
jgi:hypothetical protein